VSYIGNSALPFNPLATSGKPRDAQRFNGDNTTTTFTLNFRVDNATDLEVFVDNVQQEPLTAYDALANQLTFTEAPPSGTNNIYVVYRNTDSGIFANIPDGSITFNKLANNIRLFTTDNFTGDGGTATFTLSSDVPDANTLVVAVDGVFQRAPIHYTASNNTITFSSAPPVSSNVHVRHLGFRTTQTITALPANTTISQPVLQSPSYTGTLTGGTGEINIGSGQFFKDANGNVGIGTSSPSSVFTISVGGADGIEIGPDKNASDRSGRLFLTTSATPGQGFSFHNIEGQGLNINRGAVPGVTTGSPMVRIALNGQQSSVIPDGTTLYPEYKCRAWVNFNGTGTVAIRGSGNVSSITDNGTGDYTVNFTTAMPDVNYAVSGLTGTDTSDSAMRLVSGGYLAGSTRIRTQTIAGVQADRTVVTFLAFR
jgi:hypothetical protein